MGEFVKGDLFRGGTGDRAESLRGEDARRGAAQWSVTPRPTFVRHGRRVEAERPSRCPGMISGSDRDERPAAAAATGTGPNLAEARG